VTLSGVGRSLLEKYNDPSIAFSMYNYYTAIPHPLSTTIPPLINLLYSWLWGFERFLLFIYYLHN
jgi:hypothetical protein